LSSLDELLTSATAELARACPSRAAPPAWMRAHPLPVVAGGVAAVTDVFVARVHAAAANSAQPAIPQRIEVRMFRMSWFKYARRGWFLPSSFGWRTRARRSRFPALDGRAREIDPRKSRHALRAARRTGCRRGRRCSDTLAPRAVLRYFDTAPCNSRGVHRRRNLLFDANGQLANDATREFDCSSSMRSAHRPSSDYRLKAPVF
jgi:hypothetical protein